MTALEIFFSVLCPLALIGWGVAIVTARGWRSAYLRRYEAINRRKEHPLHECILRAGRANVCEHRWPSRQS